MKQEYGLHTNVILNTMFMFAGADYKNTDTSKDNWYFKYAWSEETEKEFKDWMINYIHKLKPAQRELYGNSYMKKSDCERAVDMFLLSYGWCHKQPEWWLKEQKNGK